MKNKYVNYFIASALFCIGTTNLATAQWAEGSCGINSATRKMEMEHPELVQKRIDYNNALTAAVKNKNKTATPPTYIIPIVFHIIHLNGPENISDAQVFAQVAKMNEDWRKQNADTNTIVPAFVNLACDTHIEFRLAQIDPNGNCTNGIDRIYSHNTIDCDGSAKMNQWPRDKYMNVWVVSAISCGSTGAAGYALYPSAVDFFYPADGVVMLASVCNGSSRVLSHEIAHCFSLEHTFGDTNNPGVTCADDLVDDTPITKGHPGTCDMTPICSTGGMAAIYSFSTVTATSGATDTAHVNSTTYAQHGQFMATGVSANSSVSGQFAFTNWDLGGLPLDGTMDGDPFGGPSLYPAMTGAINTGKYYQVTVDTIKGTSITITGLTFAFQRNATGVRSFAVRSSLDGYTANLPASVISDTLLKIKGTNEFFVRYDTTASLLGAKITLGAAYTNLQKPVTFRIYGWNAEDAAGSFGIDNFTVTGSAGIVENTQNYMEYATCPVMFTLGQRDRMEAALNSPVAQRNNLWLTSNLIATGTAPTSPAATCVPHPEFYANRYSVCPGGTVTFSKNVMYGTPATVGSAPAWKWTFAGGSPATSTVANPLVTYNTPGSYAVTLWAENASGKDSVIKTNYISVSDAYAQVIPGLTTDDFENSSLFWSRWHTEDLDANGHTWYLNTTTGYSGHQSIFMSSYNDFFHDVDNIYSPSYDLSFVGSATLSFKCAAATRAVSAADMTDQLKVYVSKDCGATWPYSHTFSGTTISAPSTSPFINNGYHAEEFVPTNASQWGQLAMTIPSIYSTGNVRFKFEYTSGQGNNDVYIDDVNLSGVLGVNNTTLDETNVSLYPNPANQSTTLAYHLNTKANTRIEVIDVLGKKIMEQNTANQTEGDYTVQISKQDLHLHNGIYFVKVSVDNNSITKKLIITE